MNGKFSRLYVFFCLIVFSITFIDSHSSNSIINQERLNAYAPIVLTGNGIRTFFSKTFNMPEFAQDIFPNDLSSFVQCLNYAQKKYQTRTHGKHVLRLFTGKLRDCSYVNASAFSSMLEDATPIWHRYVQGMADKKFDLWQKSIDKLLCDAFIQRFSAFKEKPVAFLHELSSSIIDSFYEQDQGDISLEEFRTSIKSFIDVGLSKLIWHPEDGIQTWKSTKAIADQLAQLPSMNVLNDEEEMHDLYDTLIKRYCFFLDIVSTDLPVSFFEEMKKELSARTIRLIDCGELEACIKTKRDYLVSALLEAEARSIAERITV